MHRELSKLGFSTSEHYALAEWVLGGRETKSLTALSEEEALLVWNAARQEAGKRAGTARRLKSEDDAATALN
jgi:hypothetical protein